MLCFKRSDYLQLKNYLIESSRRRGGQNSILKETVDRRETDDKEFLMSIFFVIELETAKT